MAALNLHGAQFGLLTVTGRDVPHTAPSGKKKSKWLCLCVCGNTTSSFQFNLIGGKSTSCGCKRIDAGIARFTKHGGKHTRLYKIWMLMKYRCANKSNKNYGGRGIAVCEAWQEYVPFRDWALGNGYGPTLTIERVNNNKGYSPDNCAWITQHDQAKNRRTCRPVVRGDGKEYPTLRSAARDAKTTVRRILTAIAKNTEAGGFEWRASEAAA